MKGDTKDKCSAIRSLPCSIDRPHKNVISVENSYQEQGHRLKFIQGEVKFSHEPVECQMPSVKNNPRAKWHILGRPALNPLATYSRYLSAHNHYTACERKEKHKTHPTGEKINSIRFRQSYWSSLTKNFTWPQLIANSSNVIVGKFTWVTLV